MEDLFFKSRFFFFFSFFSKKKKTFQAFSPCSTHSPRLRVVLELDALFTSGAKNKTAMVETTFRHMISSCEREEREEN